MQANPESALASTKPPVVRGARACTTCRAAKMKCVGAEDDEQARCQRCRRANVPCVFEKHRRGRKPGSKLSEASKMLRRLEKGLNSAKLKSETLEAGIPPSFPVSDSRSASSADPAQGRPSLLSSSGERIGTATELPPLNLPEYGGDGYHRPMDVDADDRRPRDSDPASNEDEDQGEAPLYPLRVIGSETQRTSFLATVLGPSAGSSHSHRSSSSTVPASAAGSNPSSRASTAGADRTTAYDRPPPNTEYHHYSRFPVSSHVPPPPQPRYSPSSPTLSSASAGHTSFRSPDSQRDPITEGILNEADAKRAYEMFFIRLNPFINLFDPSLHTFAYVRNRSSFLFTAILMAGCKYWFQKSYQDCKNLAHDLAVSAFKHNWKSVEVVQAFSCLTYWKDAQDSITWTYIGYGARMAIELGLNRYVARPPEWETELQCLERRNRERTYLVLFVHDRSLSMQTGRQWMLSEDEIVHKSERWHECVPREIGIRPEDVILVSMVSLRRIATSAIEELKQSLHKTNSPYSDTAAEHPLIKYNEVLEKEWAEKWGSDMSQAKDVLPFHQNFLKFFRLYISLFLNSYGIRNSLLSTARVTASYGAPRKCYDSATGILNVVIHGFADLGVLQYGQETINVMTAFAAIFLLRLVRSPNTNRDLPSAALSDIHGLIKRTADVYEGSAPSSNPVLYHATFLRSLVQRDEEVHAAHRPREEALDLRLHAEPSYVQRPPPTRYLPPPQVSSGYAELPPPPPSFPIHPQGSYPPMQSSNSYPQHAVGTSVTADRNHPPQAYPPNSYESQPQASPNGHYYHPPPPDGMRTHDGGHAIPYHDISSNYLTAPPHASQGEATYWDTMMSEIGNGGNQWLIRTSS